MVEVKYSRGCETEWRDYQTREREMESERKRKSKEEELSTKKHTMAEAGDIAAQISNQRTQSESVERDLQAKVDRAVEEAMKKHMTVHVKWAIASAGTYGIGVLSGPWIRRLFGWPCGKSKKVEKGIGMGEEEEAGPVGFSKDNMLDLVEKVAYATVEWALRQGLEAVAQTRQKKWPEQSEAREMARGVLIP